MNYTLLGIGAATFVAAFVGNVYSYKKGESVTANISGVVAVLGIVAMMVSGIQ